MLCGPPVYSSRDSVRGMVVCLSSLHQLVVSHRTSCIRYRGVWGTRAFTVTHSVLLSSEAELRMNDVVLLPLFRLQWSQRELTLRENL